MSTIQSIDFAQDRSAPLADVTVRLHPADPIVIAKTSLQAGIRLTLAGGSIVVRQTIPSGHKLAVVRVAKGDALRRYGHIIGFAACDIQPGEHVHTHNVTLGDFARDYAFGHDARPITPALEPERRTFLGYRRADGHVGTRNYLAVIASVNCSAHVTREIAHSFTRERLSPYSNVDGVMALAHPYGCPTGIGGPDYDLLQRVLAGMAQHPNVGAYVLVGLGCESNQVSALMHNYNLQANPLLIQELGGTRQTIEAGIQTVEQLLPHVNAFSRTPQPVSALTLALQCGGSDGWSGITANPLVGLVADEIVRQGGSVVLAETPEIYGAEHLLTRRAIDREVGEQLIAKVRWWEEHTRRLGTEIDNNPSPGNKAGGLTTIYEKALGAIAKSGSTPLTGVYAYAEPITARGFAFMDSPGYDPVSVTGQVAGGCNLVLFTTGRGSVFGFKPAPSIKIATNSTIFKRMIGDMDFDAGRLLNGEPIETLAAELLELALAVASGRPTKSEAQGIGEAEFNVWHLGETL